MDNLTPQPNEGEQKDFLADVEDPLYQYEYASQWQRFFNLFIDNLLMRFGLSWATGTLVAHLLNEIAPDFLYSIVNESGTTWSLYFLGYLIVIFNYLVYYTLCEKLFKGYTLGKLITGTRAIRQDGEELSFKNAFMRSLIRLVPFEILSGFSTLTWHDSWTNTMVIKSR